MNQFICKSIRDKNYWILFLSVFIFSKITISYCQQQAKTYGILTQQTVCLISLVLKLKNLSISCLAFKWTNVTKNKIRDFSKRMHKFKTLMTTHCANCNFNFKSEILSHTYNYSEYNENVTLTAFFSYTPRFLTNYFWWRSESFYDFCRY